MQDERRAGLGERVPERVEIDMAGRMVTGNVMRDPDGFHPELQRRRQFDQCEIRIVKRHDPDTHQAFVVTTEVAHRPVVGTGRAVTQFVVSADGPTLGERRHDAVCRKDELLREPEHVEGQPIGRRHRTRRAPGSPSTRQ